MEVALTEPRFMVTLVGRGKSFMVAPMLVDVIRQLHKGDSLTEAAQALASLWQQEISAAELQQIIEEQLVSRGIARLATEATGPQPDLTALPSHAAPKQPLHKRLLRGEFYWPMLKREVVGKICGPLTVLYEPFTAIVAAILIIATRWLLYTSVDRHLFLQLTLDFSPAEYLLVLAMIIGVVLVHEFGHAAAQLKFGLPVGIIGFQLYYYLPAFFANVSDSWGLKPARRMVVDAGGIYFQGLAGSLLYLLYLQTHYLPFLSAVLASDMLCLVSTNPFLRYDGYWLLADALAVPNLQQLSQKLRSYYWGRLLGREQTQAAPTLTRARIIIVVAYGLLKNCFWVLLVGGFILRAPAIFISATATISRFLGGCLDGFRTFDPALVVASFIRLGLFLLLLLALSTLLGNMAFKLVSLGQSGLGRLLPRLRSQAATS